MAAVRRDARRYPVGDTSLSLTRRRPVDRLGIRDGVRRLLGLGEPRDRVDDEIAAHLALRAEQLEARGWSPEAARREAERRFGSLDDARWQLHRSTSRRDRRLRWHDWVQSVGQDLRYAVRQHRRHAGFSVAIVLMLALGIGANTVLFSVVNAVFLRPPAAVRAPERLVAVFTSDFSGPPYGTSSLPDVADVRRLSSDVFEGVTAYSPGIAGVGSGDDLERLTRESVADDYFTVLGVRAQLGRTFSPDEEQPHGPPAAVISDALWRRRFGGNGRVLGQRLLMNGRPVTIVGVAPAGFHGSLRGLSVDLWTPAAVDAGDDATSRGSRSWFVLARLRPGVDVPRAQTAMTLLARQLHAMYPDTWTDVTRHGRRLTVLAERDTRVPPSMRGQVLGFVAILFSTVALALLICCANVAGLLVARGASRGREMAIRASVGAARRRLVRQLLTESLLLAGLGGLAGIALATWAARALMSITLPVPVTVMLDLSLDPRVLCFSLLVSMATGVIFGLVPALRASRFDLVPALKSEGLSERLRRSRFTLQGILVSGQVAMSVLLIACAMLFVRSLSEAASIDPGFDAEHVFVLPLEARADVVAAADPAALLRLTVKANDRVASLPGVRSVSWTSAVPLDLGNGRRDVRVDGYKPRDGEDMEFHYSAVGPRYFETMRISMARGRGFTERDRAGAPPVLVVNQAFAQRFWPGQDPIGKRVALGGNDDFAEVVGVARYGKYVSLGDTERLYFWYPSLQLPGRATLVVRTRDDAPQLVPTVRRALSLVTPELQLIRPTTMDAVIANSVLPQRIAGWIMSLVGAAALLLVAIGLYGVIAYTVARRTREFGVRIALGATGPAVRRLVFSQGMWLVTAGLLVGMPLAWGASQLLRGFVIGGATDWPLAMGGAGMTLATVALIAMLVPANRAVRVDPITALRSD